MGPEKQSGQLPQNLEQSCSWDASAHAGVSFPSTLTWEGIDTGFPNLHIRDAGTVTRNVSLEVLCALLVHLGSYNRKLETRWLISNRNLFLPVLEAVSLHSREGEGTFWGLFYKDVNPIHAGSSIMTSWPPRGTTSKSHHTGD